MKEPTSLQLFLSENIKYYREKLGLSQAKLAEIADISTGYMNDIEKRHHWADAGVLERIATALDVTVAALMEPRNLSKVSPVAKAGKAIASVKKHFDKMIEDIEKEIFDEMIREAVERVARELLEARFTDKPIFEEKPRAADPAAASEIPSLIEKRKREGGKKRMVELVEERIDKANKEGGSTEMLRRNLKTLKKSPKERVLYKYQKKTVLAMRGEGIAENKIARFLEMPLDEVKEIVEYDKKYGFKAMLKQVNEAKENL